MGGTLVRVARRAIAFLKGQTSVRELCNSCYVRHVPVDEANLAFFSSLSGNLSIELTKPPEPISEHLMNLKASPEAKIASIELSMQVYLRGERTFRPLTDAEWNQVVIVEPSIKMRGESGKVLEHRAPDGTQFTVRDLTAAVCETEKQGRGDSEWYGGIDVHHVFFEGIVLDDGVWRIRWGS